MLPIKPATVRKAQATLLRPELIQAINEILVEQFIKDNDTANIAMQDIFNRFAKITGWTGEFITGRGYFDVDKIKAAYSADWSITLCPESNRIIFTIQIPVTN